MCVSIGRRPFVDQKPVEVQCRMREDQSASEVPYLDVQLLEIRARGRFVELPLEVGQRRIKRGDPITIRHESAGGGRQLQGIAGSKPKGIGCGLLARCRPGTRAALGGRAIESQIRFWVLRCEYFDFVQMEIFVVRQPDPHETGLIARGRDSQRRATLDAMERRAIVPIDLFPRLAIGR